MANTSITIVGNLTDDPELRFTPAGAAVCNFTIACNSRFKNQSGEWEDKLDGFFRCNAWRDMAENIAESMHKGDRVLVYGRLNQRSWQTDEGKRSTVEITVEECGPSVRWAVTTTRKVSKSTGSGGGGQAPQSDWGTTTTPPPVEEGGF